MAIDERTLTLEEFLQLPEEGETALEYFDGVVEQKLPADADHGAVQSWLAARLNDVGESRRLGLAFIETRFSTDRFVLVPDISFYVKARIRRTDRGRLGDFRIPPDVAVEIITSGQSVSPVVRKCSLYLDLGVRAVVLVDPDDETIFDFRPGRPPRVLRGADRLDLDEILPGLELTAGEIFDSIVPDWLQDKAASTE